MTVFEPSAADSPASNPSLPAESTQAAIQHLIDLHFSVRDGIATLFDCPGSRALSEAHRAIDLFLETERQVALHNADVLAALGVERVQLLYGRSSIEHALSRVVWSELGSDALERSVEDLRLKFLEHAEVYCRSRSTKHATPPAAS